MSYSLTIDPLIHDPLMCDLLNTNACYHLISINCISDFDQLLFCKICYERHRSFKSDELTLLYHLGKLEGIITDFVSRLMTKIGDANYVSFHSHGHI